MLTFRVNPNQLRAGDQFFDHWIALSNARVHQDKVTVEVLWLNRPGTEVEIREWADIDHVLEVKRVVDTHGRALSVGDKVRCLMDDDIGYVMKVHPTTDLRIGRMSLTIEWDGEVHPQGSMGDEVELIEAANL